MSEPETLLSDLSWLRRPRMLPGLAGLEVTVMNQGRP
jgi:hypothetical protein